MLPSQAIHSQVTATPERGTLMGFEGWIVPATCVREQVLRNNIGRMYVSSDEIAASADRWNMMPVTVGHPRNRGRPISARQTQVLNDMGLGWLINARVEDGELKADTFLADQRLEALGLEDLIATLESGEPFEVSTSFDGDFFAQTGSFDGETYDVVAENLEPDHFAILLDETGACSIEDGCGLGVNEDEEEGAEEKIDADLAAAVSDEGLVRGLANGIADAIRRTFGGAENQEGEFSLDDRRDALRDAIETAAGGPNVFTHIVEMFEDSVVYSVDPQGGEATLFRAPYEVDEEERTVTLGQREQVEKVVEFVPAENGEVEVVANYLAIQNEFNDRIDELLDEWAEQNDATKQEAAESAGEAAGIDADTVLNIASGNITGDGVPRERIEGFAEFFGVSEQSLLDLLPEGADALDDEDEEADNRRVEPVVEYRRDGDRLAAHTRFRARLCCNEERTMDREELIDLLADNEDVPFDREALEGMGNEQLAYAANAAGVDLGGDGEADEAEEEEPSSEAQNAAGDEGGDEEPPAWATSIADRVDEIGDRLATLEEETAPVREDQEERKEQLRQAIASNSSFTEEELAEKGLAELKKIHGLTRPVDFSGIGGPSRGGGTAENEGVEFDTPAVMSGPRGEAAIDED